MTTKAKRGGARSDLVEVHHAIKWVMSPEAPAVLTPSDRAVLVALWFHANEDRIAWPSYPRLGKCAGVSARSAQTIVKRLEGYRLLVIDAGGGAGNPNRYLLAAPPTPKTRKQLPRSAAEESRKGLPRSEGANLEAAAPERGSWCTKTRKLVHENQEAASTERLSERILNDKRERLDASPGVLSEGREGESATEKPNGETPHPGDEVDHAAGAATLAAFFNRSPEVDSEAARLVAEGKDPVLERFRRMREANPELHGLKKASGAAS